MCSSIWSRSLIFFISQAQRRKISRKRQFTINLVVNCTLSNMIVLWRKIFIQEFWNYTEKPKKNLIKESWRRTSGTTKWDKLGQVGVVERVGQGEGGFQMLVGQVKQGDGGLQIFVGQVGQGQGVCPLEPFHLSQMGLQGRAKFVVGAPVRKPKYWKFRHHDGDTSRYQEIQFWYRSVKKCLRVRSMRMGFYV